MLAIEKLRRSGLSTRQIAEGVGCSEHSIRNYERYKRFPDQKRYLCIVELAESRSLTLYARDFLPPPKEMACEPNGEGAHV